MKHLNDLERRLNDAAEETRRAAYLSTPPGIHETRRSVRSGWLAFAGVFAVVMLAFGILSLSTGSTDPGVVGGTSTNTVAETPSTTAQPVNTTLPAATTTAPAAPEGCSAEGTEVPDDQSGLPGMVAEMRRAISTAAVACDFDTLRSLAGPELNTSFGGGEFDNIRRWEEEATYPALSILVRVRHLLRRSRDRGHQLVCLACRIYP